MLLVSGQWIASPACSYISRFLWLSYAGVFCILDIPCTSSLAMLGAPPESIQTSAFKPVRSNNTCTTDLEHSMSNIELLPVLPEVCRPNQASNIPTSITTPPNHLTLEPMQLGSSCRNDIEISCYESSQTQYNNSFLPPSHQMRSQTTSYDQNANSAISYSNQKTFNNHYSLEQQPMNSTVFQPCQQTNTTTTGLNFIPNQTFTQSYSIGESHTQLSTVGFHQHFRDELSSDERMDHDLEQRLFWSPPPPDMDRVQQPADLPRNYRSATTAEVGHFNPLSVQ